MESVETTGTTIQDAIDTALQQLGATREEVEVEILENPSRGLLGLVGNRSARVRVTKNKVSVEAVEATAKETVDNASVAQATAEPTGHGSSRIAPAVPTEALAERSAQLLRAIVDKIGGGAAVEVRPHEEGILLELTGDESGILIGRHGQMLDALEYIINRALLRDDEHAARVIIDANNYRSRRRTSLEELAHRMAEQAKRKGKPIMLNPMPPQDRRIIHLVLQDDPALTTRSSGDGILRRLVIIPQGAAYNPRDFE